MLDISRCPRKPQYGMASGENATYNQAAACNQAGAYKSYWEHLAGLMFDKLSN